MRRLRISPELQAAVDAATVPRIEDPRGFDAIVVGGGAAGSLVAQLLTAAGLEVLLLDAGWRSSFIQAPVRTAIATFVRCVASPRLQDKLPPRIIDLGRRALRYAGNIRQPVQSQCYAWEMAPQSFVDDRESPYVCEPGTLFNWYRAHQLGGRMIIPGHGRQYYRFGAHDFLPGDGLSPAWGFAPGELDPWYDQVERLLGLVGRREHSAWVPDPQVATLMEPSAAEAEFCERIKQRWQEAEPILGRSAPPLAGLDTAARTARLFCRTGARVRDVAVDASGQTTGVNFHDRATGRVRQARASLVFLCASSLESTRILLCSRAANTRGLARTSDCLGRYLMDHVMLSASGFGDALPGEPVPLVPGRCVYLPRFDRREPHQRAVRGYGTQIYRWSADPGKSHFRGVSFAEMTPRPDNRVILDPARKDAWGLPVLRVRCRHDAVELQRAVQQSEALRESAQLLGVRLYSLDHKPAIPGSAIHECGTARMGERPDSSVLDPHNECWDAKGLFVTDGAAFASQGMQNPTLTILALTARACDYAVRRLRRTATAAGAPERSERALKVTTPT